MQVLDYIEHNFVFMREQNLWKKLKILILFNEEH